MGIEARPIGGETMPAKQLQRFAPAEAANLDARGMAFRPLRLQGRALGRLLPRALESPPMLDNALHRRIVDAERRRLKKGHVSFAQLARRAPWGFGER